MIVCLYNSNYPIEKNGIPKWDSLPIGYLLVKDSTQIDLSEKVCKIKGIFIFNKLKPRIGEHLLAVFSLNDKNYLYNSTIHFSSRVETDSEQKSNFDAELGLTSNIREWDCEVFD